MSGEVEKCLILHVCPKFDVFTLVPDTKTSFFFVRIPYFFEKTPLKIGDILWGRFDQFFFVFGYVSFLSFSIYCQTLFRVLSADVL